MKHLLAQPLTFVNFSHKQSILKCAKMHVWSHRSIGWLMQKKIWQICCQPNLFPATKVSTHIYTYPRLPGWLLDIVSRIKIQSRCMLTVATAFCAALSSSCQSFLGTGPTGNGIPERFGLQGIRWVPKNKPYSHSSFTSASLWFWATPRVCKTSSLGCKLRCDFVHQWANKPCDKPKKLRM